MVPTRTLNPAWSPDSKWVAYASAPELALPRDLRRATSRRARRSRSPTASPTRCGRRGTRAASICGSSRRPTSACKSQWLDMTSYDHDENFGLYLGGAEEGRAEPAAAGERRGHGRRRRRPAAAAAVAAAAPVRRRARSGAADAAAHRAARAGRRVHDRFRRTRSSASSRCPACPSGSTRNCSAGVAGTVYFLEAAAGGGGRGGAGGGGGTLHRYSPARSPRRAVRHRRRRLRRERRRPQAALSRRRRRWRRRRPRRRRRGSRPRRSSSSTPTATPPQAGQGRLDATLRMYLDPKEEFKQIFNEGWRNQRDYLYVPNMHGADWPKMKEMYGALLPYVKHRADLNYLLDMMGAEIAIGHSYVRGGDMPDVPAVARRPARRRLRDRQRPLQDHADLRQRELESRSARAARRARRRRLASATTSSRSTASS